MIDLSTNYLGLQLRTPLVASASPLSHELSGIRRLEDVGASAVVLYSLFEEQIRRENHNLEYFLQAGTESFAEAVTYLPQALDFHVGPEEYLAHIVKWTFLLSPASTALPWAGGRTMRGESSKPARPRSSATFIFCRRI
jgi:hypothetical protein